jgi:hypothetical protein
MSTRSDPGNLNAGVYGFYSENAGTSTSPIDISQGPPDTFNLQAGDTWDYNLIGAHASGRFLATWGGDSRLGTNDVWSCVVQ